MEVKVVKREPKVEKERDVIQKGVTGGGLKQRAV